LGHASIIPGGRGFVSRFDDAAFSEGEEQSFCRDPTHALQGLPCSGIHGQITANR